jgi:hypothetical protein
LADRALAAIALSLRTALNSRAFARTLRHSAALHSPNMRARLSAGAAMAGWHNGSAGWWRHSNGGYGWVEPLFWPFAYFDIYDYAIWGSAARAPFWGYGYDDIYTGMFAPYDYDALAGYLPLRGAPGASDPDWLAQLCARTVPILPACRSISFGRLSTRRRRNAPRSMNSPMLPSPPRRRSRPPARQPFH